MMKEVYGLPIDDDTRSVLFFTPDHHIVITGKELQALWFYFNHAMQEGYGEEDKRVKSIITKAHKGF